MRIRSCDACGGGAEVYITRNGKYGSSCFVACVECGMRTRLYHLGTQDESGMVKEAVRQWESHQSDTVILDLQRTVRRLTETIDEYKQTDAEAMARSYRRYVSEEGQ